MGARAFAVSLLVSAMSCASGLTLPTGDQNGDRKIVLALGESQPISDTNLVVTFEAVAEDSRCPTGVTCIWAGDAAVRIRIDAPKARPSTYTLHTNERMGRDVMHGGLRVQLVAVTPYPAADKQPRADEYRVTLLIQRA